MAVPLSSLAIAQRPHGGRNPMYLIDYYVNSCNSRDGIVNALIGGIGHSDIQYIVPGQSRKRMASSAAGEQHLRIVKLTD